MIRLDLETRTELSRTPLDVGEGFGTGVRLPAANGARILDIQRDRSLVLRDQAGAEITVLYQGPRKDVLRSGISVSPSGRLIAMFDRAGEQRTARLVVWDALSGKKLSDRTLGYDYLWRFTPVWVNRESTIALVRKSGTGASVELFRSE